MSVKGEGQLFIPTELYEKIINNYKIVFGNIQLLPDSSFFQLDYDPLWFLFCLSTKVFLLTVCRFIYKAGIFAALIFQVPLMKASCVTATVFATNLDFLVVLNSSLSIRSSINLISQLSGLMHCRSVQCVTLVSSPNLKQTAKNLKVNFERHPRGDTSDSYIRKISTPLPSPNHPTSTHIMRKQTVRCMGSD